MKLITGNVWLVVLIAIGLSFIAPAFGSLLAPYVAPLLALLMFFSTLSIHLRHILRNLAEFEKTAATVLIVHLISPLIIFLLKDLFSEPIYLGLIIATSSSAGISAVFLSSLFGGQPDRALVTTALSTFLSPLLIPLLVFIFARTSINVDVTAMTATIVKLVILPYFASWIARRTPLGEPLKKISMSASIILLFILIIGIMSPTIPSVLENIQLSITLGLLITVLLLINFALGFSIGKNRPEHITYAISASYKNYALSTVIALSLFNPMVAVPSVIYSVVSNLLLIPLQFATKRK